MPLGGPRFGGPTGGPQNKTTKIIPTGLCRFFISKIRAATFLFPIAITRGFWAFGATKFFRGFFGCLFGRNFRAGVIARFSGFFIGFGGGLFFFHAKKCNPSALRGIGGAS